MIHSTVSSIPDSGWFFYNLIPISAFLSGSLALSGTTPTVHLKDGWYPNGCFRYWTCESSITLIEGYRSPALLTWSIIDAIFVGVIRHTLMKCFQTKDECIIRSKKLFKWFLIRGNISLLCLITFRGHSQKDTLFLVMWMKGLG